MRDDFNLLSHLLRAYFTKKSDILLELTPAEEARRRGLKSIGFGRYVDPANPGTVVAKIENDRLVAVSPDEEEPDKKAAPSEAPPKTSPKEQKKLQKADRGAVLDSLRYTESQYREDRAKMKSGEIRGVGAGTNESRAGETAIVYALQKLQESSKSFSTTEEAMRWLERRGGVFDQLEKIAADPDSFLKPDWVAAARRSLPVILDEVGGIQNIQAIVWDTPEGNKMANVEGHDTSSDMFVVTKDGLRWGISLKKSGDVFLLNGGLATEVDKLVTEMLNNGDISQEEADQLKHSIGIEAYERERKKELQDQAQFYLDDEAAFETFDDITYWLWENKDTATAQKIMKQNGMSRNDLVRIKAMTHKCIKRRADGVCLKLGEKDPRKVKEFFYKGAQGLWSAQDVKIFERMQRVAAQYLFDEVLADPSLQKNKKLADQYRQSGIKMKRNANGLREIGRRHTLRFLDQIDKDENIERGVKNVILHGIHFHDAMGFGKAIRSGKLDRFRTVYGLPPDGAVLNGETLINLIGDTPEEKQRIVELRDAARQGDQKAADELTAIARSKIIIDTKDKASAGTIRIRRTNPDPPPPYFYFSLFEVNIRERGIGTAPIFEIGQKAHMAYIMKEGTPDFKKWKSIDNKINWLASIVQDYKRRLQLKVYTDAENRRIREELDAYQALYKKLLDERRAQKAGK